MASAQGEIGGKDILLKVAGALTPITAVAATDVFTVTGHGLAINDLVELKSLTGGAGILVDTLYFVITVPSSSTFTLSLTKGGSTIAVTSDLTAPSTAYLYKNVGGIRSKSLAVNGEMVDVTNQDSQQWREVLDGAGINSVSCSGSGVFENGTVIGQIRTDILARNLRYALLIVNSDYDLFKGCFKFTSFEYSGDYNAESNYSISMESSGEVTYTAQP